jgi:hypothetical protein
LVTLHSRTQIGGPSREHAAHQAGTRIHMAADFLVCNRLSSARQGYSDMLAGWSSTVLLAAPFASTAPLTKDGAIWFFSISKSDVVKYLWGQVLKMLDVTAGPPTVGWLLRQTGEPCSCSPMMVTNIKNNSTGVVLVPRCNSMAIS